MPIEPGTKRALDWINVQLRDNPGTSRVALVDEASRRFDLSPLEGEFLYCTVFAPTSKAA